MTGTKKSANFGKKWYSPPLGYRYSRARTMRYSIYSGDEDIEMSQVFQKS